MQALLALADVSSFIESLCIRYCDLELDKREFLACLHYVLKNNPFLVFNQESFHFLPYDFAKHKEQANILKKNDEFTAILDDLCDSSLEHSEALVHHSLFKATDDSEGINLMPNANNPDPTSQI